MEQILNNILNAPTEVWIAIGGMIGVSAILQGLKHWFSLQSDKVITALLTALSFVAATFDYLNQAVATNPSILGAKTAAIVGGATVSYRFVVKPFSKLLEDAKAERERKAASTPAQPAPTQPTVFPAVSVTSSSTTTPVFISTPAVVPPTAPPEFDA